MTEPQAISSNSPPFTELGTDLSVPSPQPQQVESVAAASLSPQQITRHSAVNMVGGIVSQGLKFLVVIYVARHFSTADFGVFSFAWAVYAFIFVLAHFGLPVLGTRQVAQRGRVSSTLLANVALSRAVLALASTAVALLIFSLVPRITRTELWLLALFGLSNVGSATLFDWAFQGLGRLEISAILNIIWQGSWLLFTFIGARMGGGIATVGIALCASVTLASLTGYLWLRRLPGTEHTKLSLRSTARYAWSIVVSGSALGVGTILITVLVWTDVIFVRLLKGEHAAGIYSAGNRLTLGLAMLATFYVQGAFPVLSHAGARSRKQFEQCFQQTYEHLALLFLPGSIWAIVYAEPIMRFLFGRADYVAAVPIFRIFQLVLILFVANTLFGTGLLVALHHDSSFQRALGFSAFALLVGCPILIVLWGIEGSAVMACLAEIICLFAFYFMSRSLARLHHMRALLRPVLGTSTVLGLGWLLHLHLMASAIPLSLTYLVLLTFGFQRTRMSTAG